MVNLLHLRKTFLPGTSNGRMALRDVSLHVAAGDFVTIIGSNGAGKSTLLNAVAGVFPVDEGTIVIDGKDVTWLPEHQRALAIGRVFQDPMQGTAGSMSIEENLSMAAKRGQARRLVRGVAPKDRAAFREYLSLLDLGLENRLADPVRLLSGGQRQALALLMATIAKPKLLLLDEHVAALDPKTAQDILALTDRVVRRYRLTVMMVTHNLRHALAYGNRTVMMHEGEIVLDVRDPERCGMTVADLLERFHRMRGERLSDDRILLEV